MKRLSKTSGLGSLVCPFCEAGEIERTGSNSARCISCGKVLGRWILETLRGLLALPESLGAQATSAYGTARNEASREALYFVGN